MELDPLADVGLVKNLVDKTTRKATEKLCAKCGHVKKQQRIAL